MNNCNRQKHGLKKVGICVGLTKISSLKVQNAGSLLIQKGKNTSDTFTKL